MKWFVYATLSMLVSSCYFDTPKYKIGDLVRYDVPDEYFKVCKNVATIEGIVYTVGGRVTYNLTLESTYYFGYGLSKCPDKINLYENQVRPYYTTLRENIPTNG